MTMISVGVIAFRHWMPIWPRPPAPITTTLVPEPSTGTAFLTAWMAVSPASASAAMSFGSSDGSSLTTERALVNRKSAKPPSRLMPGNEPFTQCMSSPARHGRHSPQVMNGWTITVSPTSTFVTAGADLVDPAGVLVPRRVGQRDPRLLRPLALLDVEVRSAQARRRRCGRPRRGARSPSARPSPRSCRASWYSCSRAAFTPPPPLSRRCRSGRAAASGRSRR